MLTTLVIGNRFTARKGGWMYTPRGYNAWRTGEEGQAPPAPPAMPGAVWVFSGTADGNDLALALAQSGREVVLSAASELGRELAPTHPRLHLYQGPAGQEARRRALSTAGAVLDATHPYAQTISAQLRDLCAERALPYLRFERPGALSTALSGPPLPGVIRVPDMTAAAQAAAPHERVFLATGSKDLETYLRAARTPPFVRLTPQPAVLARALELGVPSRQICAAIGPFGRDWNEAQWRQWHIQAVVTKDSGNAGGFQAKYDAARALDLPLIVIERPAPFPEAVGSLHAALEWLDETLGAALPQPPPHLSSQERP